MTRLILARAAYKYTLDFYASTNVGAVSNGLYTYSGSPMYSVTVENPDTSTSSNRLRFTESTGYVHDYEWKTNGWELTTGNGLRKEYRTESWSAGNTFKTNRIEVRDGAGTLQAASIQTFTNDASGLRLLEDVHGNGTEAHTDTMTLWTNGLAKQRVHANGSWTYAEYDALKRPTNVLSVFGAQGPTNDATLCHQFAYDYSTNTLAGSGDSGALETLTARCTIERLLGQEVGRRYFVALTGETRAIHCLNPGAAWNDGSNLVTITKTVTNAGLFHQMVQSVLHPDGAMQIYQYATNNSGYLTNTVLSGQPDSYKTNIVDGSKTVTVTGPLGEMVSHTVIDLASGLTTASETYSDLDTRNRPRKVTYLDNTFTWTDYGCCGPTTVTNRDGSVTTHYPDAANRPTASKYNNITQTNILDAAGHTLAQVRIGSDTSRITNHVSTYDTTGRRLTSKDALNNTTTYTESADGLTQTNTYPDGGTRIQYLNKDGTVQKVIGTAAHPMRYEYGVEQESSVWRAFTKEIKLDANGSDTADWTKTYRDLAGRAYKTLYADGAARQSYFNTNGQLVNEVDPDGVTTLHQYNAQGEREYTALDMDRNGTMDFSGTDRIQQSVKSVESLNGFNVVRTRHYVWATNSSAISNLTSEIQTTTDGLRSWTIHFSQITNHFRTALPGSGARYATNTAPDGSYTLSYTLNGLLQSATRKDSLNTQLSSLNYSYDAHGRRTTSTDARNGTTSFTYDNADHRLTITTPAPGTGQGAQTTSYTFDSMSRVTRTALPDGGGVTNIYSLKGETLTNFGARTYPVAHTFDAQGRQTTMTTWTNFATRTGAATTTWNFDTNRGFLLSKVYADGRGTTNTYTGAGRLATRQWARGITTTYLTNSAGQTVAVIYSDGTTPNVTNTFDRQGRITEIATSATTLRRTYSESGLLLSETNAAGPLTGVRLDYAYDSLNHLTNLQSQISNTPILNHTYAYDTTSSRLTNVTDGTYSAGYNYLANSPLINQITFRSNSTTRMTTTKQYDLLNRLLSIQSSAGVSPVASFNYVYNDANQRTLRTDADGSAWRYEYDNLGQVTSGKRAWSDNVPVAGQQYEYAYDDIGNRLSTKEGGDASRAGLRPASYSANSLNQYTTREVPAAADILGIAHPSATVTVNDLSTYRKGEYFRSELAIGNQLSPIWTNVQVIASLTGTNQTNTGNLLHPKASETFTFDADGNQTSDSLWTNSWDGENRLIVTESASAVPSGGKAKEAWTLDAQSRWIQRIIYSWNGSTYVAQSTNRYVWEGKVLLAILDHTNGLVMSFLRGLDLSGTLQGAGGVGGVLAVSNFKSPIGTDFLAYDGNGNVTALISATDGAVSARYDYDPFGRTLRESGLAAANPLRFSTQLADPIMGRLKYLYRDNEPLTGRWLNRDPIQERGGRGLYQFVRNHPSHAYDVLGQRCCLTTIKPGPRSDVGHSILECDNGAYVSRHADDDWGTREKDEEYYDRPTDPPSPPAERDQICFDCVDEDKVSQWIADQVAAGTGWSWGNNCADHVLDAIAAALPDQPRPRCPCIRGLERGCSNVPIDVLEQLPNGMSPTWTFPSDAHHRVERLNENGCNRWRCMVVCLRFQFP